MPNIIRCRFDPGAGSANRLMQYVVAQRLHRRVPEALFDCEPYPEWGVERSDASNGNQAVREKIIFSGHLIDFEDAVDKLKKSEGIEVEVASLAARMEYLGDSLSLARSLFPPPKVVTGFDDRFLVIGIRTGDIYRGSHPNYTLLPIDFYRKIIAQTGLQPVFVGQIDENAYCDALRHAFPSAIFVTGTPLADFAMLRTSRNILLAVSTFSWMAAWLSETATRILFPALGMFNPMDRPDIDLIASRDARFEFYRFPREIWYGTDEQIAQKKYEPFDPQRIRVPSLFKAEALIRCWLDGRLPEKLSLSRGLSSCMQ